MSTSALGHQFAAELSMAYPNESVASVDGDSNAVAREYSPQVSEDGG